MYEHGRRRGRCKGRARSSAPDRLAPSRASEARTSALAAATVPAAATTRSLSVLPEVSETVQLRGDDAFVVPPGKKFVVKEMIQGPGLNSHIELDVDGVRWHLRFDQQVHPAASVVTYRQVTTFAYGHEFPEGTHLQMHEGFLNGTTGQFTAFEDHQSDVLTGILVDV